MGHCSSCSPPEDGLLGDLLLLLWTDFAASPRLILFLVAVVTYSGQVSQPPLRVTTQRGEDSSSRKFTPFSCRAKSIPYIQQNPALILSAYAEKKYSWVRIELFPHFPHPFQTKILQAY